MSSKTPKKRKRSKRHIHGICYTDKPPTQSPVEILHCSPLLEKFEKEKQKSKENSTNQTNDEETPLITKKHRINSVSDPTNDNIIKSTVIEKQTTTDDSIPEIKRYIFDDTIDIPPENIEWTVKYAPKSLNEMIGNPKIDLELIHWFKTHFMEDKIPHDAGFTTDALILRGPSGVGKTCRVEALAKQFGFKIFEINSISHRDTITNFGKKKKRQQLNTLIDQALEFIGQKQTDMYDDHRYILLLDDIDTWESVFRYNDATYKPLYTIDEKLSFSGVLSPHIKASKKNDFAYMKIIPPKQRIPIIMTVNDLPMSMKALSKYCHILYVNYPSVGVISNKLIEILDNEGIPSDMFVVNRLATSAGGNIRRAISTLQLSVDLKTKSLIPSMYKLFFIPEKKRFVSQDNQVEKYKWRLNKENDPNMIAANQSDRIDTDTFKSYKKLIMISNAFQPPTEDNSIQIISKSISYPYLIPYLETHCLRQNDYFKHLIWVNMYNFIDSRVNSYREDKMAVQNIMIKYNPNTIVTKIEADQKALANLEIAERMLSSFCLADTMTNQIELYDSKEFFSSTYPLYIEKVLSPPVGDVSKAPIHTDIYQTPDVKAFITFGGLIHNRKYLDRDVGIANDHKHLQRIVRRFVPEKSGYALKERIDFVAKSFIEVCLHWNDYSFMVSNVFSSIHHILGNDIPHFDILYLTRSTNN